jgi:SAM-dependent methyltransferase
MKLVARPCPVCGSSDDRRVVAEAHVDASRLDRFAFASRKLPEYMHHRLVLCPVCQLLYASPVPTLEALASAYQAADFGSATEAGYAARTYGRLLRPALGRLPDRQGALDIGTGDGAFLKELLAAGFSGVLGVEPSEAPIAAADPTVRPLIRQGLFHREDFPERSFRLVTCFQTIEHVYEPMAMCRDVAALLKDGGLAFFVFHNRQSLSARLLGRHSPIFDIEHLQLFSRTSAEYMLLAAGFQDIRLQMVMNRYPLAYWLSLLPLPRKIKNALLATLQATRLGRLPLRLPAGNLAAFAYKA